MPNDLDNWYDDPPIVFALEGDDDFAGGPVTEAGYYVIRFCGQHCCRPFGPFPDVVTAREWSRTKMVERP